MAVSKPTTKISKLKNHLFYKHFFKTLKDIMGCYPFEQKLFHYALTIHLKYSDFNKIQYHNKQPLFNQWFTILYEKVRYSKKYFAENKLY